MKAGQRPEAIDTHLVFRAYAWITVTAGLLVYAWPAALLPHAQFPAAPLGGQWAFTRVAAALVVASGVCAAGLAGLEDPVGRRRALYAFARAHLLFGAFFFGQWYAIFDVLLPPLVGWAPLLMGGVLLYVAVTGPSAARSRRVFALADQHNPRAPAHVRVDVKSDAMDALRSQYEEHIQLAARQEERTRLARDLHDAVKQQLFVVQTSAATIGARFDHDVPGAKAALEQVRTAAREAITEMEALIAQLQATPLENTGLIDALKRQCEALAFRTGADVQFEVGELPPSHALPPGTQQSLFRGAQEALANIGRHARASHVRVSLGTTADHLDLTIRDDGVGFDPLPTAKGMGLGNMTARVAVLSGSFTLTSAPGEGTTVQFSVPCTSRSPRRYIANASMWAAVLFGALWFLELRGASHHPWAVGLAAIAGIATTRYGLAYTQVRQHAEAAA
jgi:signal transduction histidine kinase